MGKGVFNITQPQFFIQSLTLRRFCAGLQCFQASSTLTWLKPQNNPANKENNSDVLQTTS